MSFVGDNQLRRTQISFLADTPISPLIQLRARLLLPRLFYMLQQLSLLSAPICMLQVLLPLKEKKISPCWIVLAPGENCSPPWFAMVTTV